MEFEVHDAQIVIGPARSRRQGWDEAFRSMAKVGDDRLLDEDLTGQSDWDTAEWEW